MHHAYWAKSQSQHLLPTTIEALAAPPRPARWPLGAALLSCAIIFIIDVAAPGVVVGLLYSLVLIVLARAGRPRWLAAVCVVGTLLHAVAGVYDVPFHGVAVVLANRALAILVLWVIGGWIAFNLAALGLRRPASWRATFVE